MRNGGGGRRRRRRRSGRGCARRHASGFDLARCGIMGCCSCWSGSKWSSSSVRGSSTVNSSSSTASQTLFIRHLGISFFFFLDGGSGPQVFPRWWWMLLRTTRVVVSAVVVFVVVIIVVVVVVGGGKIFGRGFRSGQKENTLIINLYELHNVIWPFYFKTSHFDSLLNTNWSLSFCL